MNSDKPTLMTIVGARPQFVKAAAITRSIRSSSRLTEIIVHTGQHFDDNMSEVFFRELNIPKPDFHFDIHGGMHGAMTGKMLEAIEQTISQVRPNMVLVYGDTNSTLAGGLAAAKLNVPIAHVEAGLRSFNRRMPEEINRVVVDNLSTLLFCPTSHSILQLANEGITHGVHHVGDVMCDVVMFARDEANKKSQILDRLKLEKMKYSVCTLHRAENTDDPRFLAKLISFLEAHAIDQQIIFPVHPRTRANLAKAGIRPTGLELIEPLGYLDFNKLIASAVTVFTNSGGLQKEAYFHGVPCVTLRTETEWIETITHGWNRLWTVEEYCRPARPIQEYGTGTAAEQIVEILEAYLL